MSAGRPSPSGPLVRADELLVVLPALVLALVVVVPPLHWALRVDLLPFLVPALLDPRSGWYSLALVLWVLWVGPRVLGRLPIAPSAEATAGAAGPSARLPVPAGALDPAQREQACRALDVPWRPELATDDEEWGRAYAEALAAATRRAGG